MIEILLVLAIIGIIAGVAVVSGRTIMRSQDEAAALRTIQQYVGQGATAAASRGVVVNLERAGQNLRLRDTANNRILRQADLAESASLGWADGVVIRFLPQGRLHPDDLAAVSGTTLSLSGKQYELELSVIGEARWKELP